MPAFGALLPDVNEIFVWKAIFAPDTFYAFNKTAMMALVSTVICVVIFVVGSRKRALVPTGMQNFAETGYTLIEEQVAIETMGPEDGRKWAPFLATLFFWIFFINVWSVVPFVQFPATARFAIPLFLALMSWATFIVVGFAKQGPAYMAHAIFPPGVPKPLYVLVTPIELVSKFIVRPFSLAVRLFANMVAGHVLLTLFAIMTNELIVKHPSGWFQVPFGILPFFGLVAMTAFELLVAVLQAYIFTILTSVYVAESIHPEH